MNLKKPIVIERSHPSQSDAGLALLNQLANAPQGCRFDTLFRVFCQAKGDALPPATASKNLSNLLERLAKSGQVSVGAGHGTQRVYYFGDASKLPTTAKTRAAAAAAAAAAAQALYACQVVPPRQYDVMYGPVYVPPRSAALRPGSQDFQRLASHGYGC